MLIGGLIFRAWESLDLLGPLHVLIHAAQAARASGATTDKVDFCLVGPDTEGAKENGLLCSQGFLAYPTYTFSQCPQLDVFLLPGGVGSLAQLYDAPTLSFLKKQASAAKFVTSICTGSIVLAAAGLLDGVGATSNKMLFDELSRKYSNVSWQRDARYVHDGKYITSSGVSAGVDMGFHLAEQLFGIEAASSVADAMDYKPLPAAQDPFCALNPVKPWPVAALISNLMSVVYSPLINSHLNSVVKRPKSAEERSWIDSVISDRPRPLVVALLPSDGFELYEFGLIAESLGAIKADLSFDLMSMTTSKPSKETTADIQPKVAGQSTGGSSLVSISTHRAIQITSESSEAQISGDWPSKSESMQVLFILSSEEKQNSKDIPKFAVAIKKACLEGVKHIAVFGESGKEALRLASKGLIDLSSNTDLVDLDFDSPSPNWKKVRVKDGDSAIYSHIAWSHGSRAATVALDIVAILRGKKIAQSVALEAELALEHLRFSEEREKII